MESQMYHLLLAYLVRDIQVLRSASQTLGEELFRPEEFIDKSIVMAAIDYWNDQQSMLTRSELEAEAWRRLSSEATFGGINPINYRQMFVDKFSYIYSLTIANSDYGKKLLQEFIDERYVRPVIDSIQYEESPEEAVARLTECISSSRITGADIITGDQFLDLLHGDPPIPTGVRFFDEMTNGGPRPGNLIGVLATPSCGKTLLCIQLMVSLARSRQHCLFANYEMPIRGEFMERIVCQLARVEIDRVRGRTANELDADILERYGEALNKYGRDYMHLVDMSGADGKGTGGYIELFNIIEQLIEKLKAKGERLRFVFIDWLGCMITGYLSSNNATEYDYKYYGAFMNAFKAFAAKHGLIFVIVHQLNTREATSSPGRKPEYGNAAGAGSSFSHLTTTTFAIGRTNDEGMCWIVAGKSRGAKHSERVIHLNGKFQRFEDTDGEYVARRGRLVRRDYVGAVSVEDFDEDFVEGAE